MSEYRYAFLQMGSDVYCYLNRGNEVFDMMYFGAEKSLKENDPKFWEKWEVEAAFCRSPQRNYVDFIFMLPTDTRFPYDIPHHPQGTGWNDKSLIAFVEKKVGKENISDGFPTNYSIGSKKYSFCIYRSDEFPQHKRKNHTEVLL